MTMNQPSSWSASRRAAQATGPAPQRLWQSPIKIDSVRFSPVGHALTGLHTDLHRLTACSCGQAQFGLWRLHGIILAWLEAHLHIVGVGPFVDAAMWLEYFGRVSDRICLCATAA
jgi:hypothetical protein